jgi:uncharacterized protein YjbI with pentapeptide repeats
MTNPAVNNAIASADDFFAGKRWGDDISEERQHELEAILAVWDAETDHGDREGPFDHFGLKGLDAERLKLSGADVFYLAARTLVGSASQSNLDLDSARATLRGPFVRYRPISLATLHLEGANAESAQLEHAYLRNACLDRIVLVQAKLTDADLTGADLTNANLSEAQ